MSIWHKRNEFPHGFVEENKLFIYVFDDGIDLTEYCEKYHRCSNLKKWCVFNELLALEKENKTLSGKLEIAVKALDDAANYLVCMDELYELTGECNEQMALETINKALEKIKEIK